jgi:hypothetical protein
MSIFGALLRFARRVVEGVRGQLTQQLNVVEEMARAPIQAMVQQVVGGIWIGDGANAFVEEVSSLIIPGINQASDYMMRFDRNIQNAIDVMDRADEQVNSLVNGLGDLFDAIY